MSNNGNENNPKKTFGRREASKNVKNLISKYNSNIFKQKLELLNNKYVVEEEKIKSYEPDYFKLLRDWKEYLKNKSSSINVEQFQDRANNLINLLLESRGEFIKLLITINPSINKDEFYEKLRKRNNGTIFSKNEVEIKDHFNKLYEGIRKNDNNTSLSNVSTFYNIYEQLKKLSDSIGTINRNYTTGINLSNNIKQQYVSYLREVTDRIQCIYNYITRTTKMLITIENVKNTEFTLTKIMGVRHQSLLENITPIKEKYDAIIKNLSIESLDANLAKLDNVLILADNLQEEFTKVKQVGKNENTKIALNSSPITELIGLINVKIEHLKAIKEQKSLKNTAFGNLYSTIDGCLKEAASKIAGVEAAFKTYQKSLNENNTLKNKNNNFKKKKSKFEEISTLILQLQEQIKVAMENNKAAAANVIRATNAIGNIQPNNQNRAVVNMIIQNVLNKFNINPNLKGNLNTNIGIKNIRKKLLITKLAELNKLNESKNIARKVRTYYKLPPPTTPPPPPALNP